MSTIYDSKQLQIKLLNQIYRLSKNTQTKKRTIILYDLFENKEDPQDKIALENLQTYAKIILDNTLPVKIKKLQIDDVLVTKYVIPESESPAKTITERCFELEPAAEDQEPALDNIWIYEVQDQGLNDLRVVVIPIQKGMIDISQLRIQQEQDQKDSIAFQKRLNEQGIFGDAMKKQRAKRAVILQQRFKKRCEFAAEKHLKMFRIEAFLEGVLDKTEQVSLCCVAEFGERRFKTLNKFSRQFTELFDVPDKFEPQYLIPGYTSKKEKIVAELGNPAVTCVLSIEDKKFEIKGEFQMLQKKWFYKKEGVRTKIYQSMQGKDNKAINHVIQQFVSQWNTITKETAFAFASVVKRVYSELQSQGNNEDPNTSFESSKTEPEIKQDLKDDPKDKEVLASLNFNQIFEKYIMNSLWLQETKPALAKFYTQERLKSIQAEAKLTLIPKSIEKLVFYHFICKIFDNFEIKYKQIDIEEKNDQGKLVDLWTDTLKEIYELVNQINNSILHKEANRDLRCSDIKKFFDFLMFTFESLNKIKKITKQDLATPNQLKSSFEQLKIKKDKILRYIINNHKNIQENEPIHYYDLYLMMMRANSNKDIEKDMFDVFLHIHKLKAYRIANVNIDDNEKIVQAINSLALVALEYKSLSETKKDTIKIDQIEKKLARMLKIVGQQEFAALIYLKNRQTYFADKAYQQAFVRIALNNDQKAKKLIAWGECFQKELELDISISYYRKAFCVAKSPLIKQKALIHKFDCFNRMKKEFNEDELRPHQKFMDAEDSMQDKDAPNESSLQEALKDYTGKLQISQNLKKLKQQLSWNGEEGRSEFVKKNNPQSGILGY